MMNRSGMGPDMFETGKSIREAKLRQIREDGWQEGYREGFREGREEGIRKEIEHAKTVLKESGVSLPPEVAGQIERLYDVCDEPPRSGFLRFIKRRSRC